MKKHTPTARPQAGKSTLQNAKAELFAIARTLKAKPAEVEKLLARMTFARLARGTFCAEEFAEMLREAWSQLARKSELSPADCAKGKRVLAEFIAA